MGVPEGCEAELEWGDRVVTEGRARFATVSVRPWEDGWHIEANPRAGIDPEIAEWASSPFWRGVRYKERLIMLEILVMTMVGPLEYDCLGTSQRADMLTEEFKAECDARRGTVSWRSSTTTSRNWLG